MILLSINSPKSKYTLTHKIILQTKQRNKLNEQEKTKKGRKRETERMRV